MSLPSVPDSSNFILSLGVSSKVKSPISKVFCKVSVSIYCLAEKLDALL